jgi:hypothetical protein
MSREYYNKDDIIEIYLIEGKQFELALQCITPNHPYLFKAIFLGYNPQTNELQYQVQGNPERFVDLDDVLQIGAEYTYSNYRSLN